MKKLLFIFALLISCAAFGQVQYFDGIVIHPGAPPGSPIKGQIYYDDGLSRPHAWSGSVWQRFALYSELPAAQVLSLVINDLTLSGGGGTIDLSPYLDNTDAQQIDAFGIASNILSLSLSGDGEAPQTVDLSPYLDNTDAQDLSLSGNILSLTGDPGGDVDLSPYLDNTDNQDASQVLLIDVEENFTSPNIEGALEELVVLASQAALPVPDVISIAEDNVDGTKEARIDVGTNVPAGTVVDVSWPSTNMNLEDVPIVHPNSPNDIKRWFLGTLEEIATAQGLGQLIAGDVALPTNAQPARTGTGTAINLSDYWQYNFGAASSAGTFTMTDILDGGYAEVLVNAATEPVVTGATKRPKTASFIPSTDMILHIKDYDGTRKFWFTEFFLWWIILIGFRRKTAT